MWISQKIRIVLLVWFWGFAHTPPEFHLHHLLRDTHIIPICQRVKVSSSFFIHEKAGELWVLWALRSEADFPKYKLLCEQLLYASIFDNTYSLYLFFSWSIISIQQHESAICIHIPPPPSASLPPHPCPIPLRSSQSTKLSCLCYIAASHQLAILHIVVYICSVYMSVLLSQFIPPSLSPAVSISSFSRSASLLLPCK